MYKKTLLALFGILLYSELSYAGPLLLHRTCRVPKEHVVCQRIVYPDYYSSYAFHASEACTSKPIKLVRYRNN